MANVQAIIDLPEELYLSLSAVGMTRATLVQESRRLLALKFYQGKWFVKYDTFRRCLKSVSMRQATESADTRVFPGS